MILDDSFREFDCPPADVKAIRHVKSIINEKESGEKPRVNNCV